MDPIVEAARLGFSSGVSVEPKHGEFGFGVNEIYGVSPGPPSTGRNSFTALLELPPPSTVELLLKESIPAKASLPPFFPSNIALIDRASKFSIFASADDSPECNSMLTPASSLKLDAVKQESLGSDSHRNSSSPVVSNQSRLKPSRRKDRVKKDKESNKKSNKVVANETGEDGGQNLPYVHVRARRGQATDSHSLAERARRENINARMKLLQEMVPGCNKISGVALVLDEIINHVQALQRQVEILSMELVSVDPIIDFNLDALLTAENGSSADNSYPGMFTTSIWGDEQINGDRQQQCQHQWHFDELHQPSF